MFHVPTHCGKQLDATPTRSEHVLDPQKASLSTSLSSKNEIRPVGNIYREFSLAGPTGIDHSFMV